MKNRVMVACLVLAGMLGLSAQASAAVFAGGNFDAAHACQRGGYFLQLGTNGASDTFFVSSGDCVSYAANGGVVVALAAVQPCLAGGYEGLEPAGGVQAFASEAGCTLYIAQGGTPVPFVSAPTLSGNILGPSTAVTGACALAVSGSGLKPGTTLTFTVPNQGTFTLVAVDKTTPIVVGSGGTVNVTTYIYPGFSATLSATTAAGGTISSTSFDTTC